jgi:hypothetical protein
LVSKIGSGTEKPTTTWLRRLLAAFGVGGRGHALGAERDGDVGDALGLLQAGERLAPLDLEPRLPQHGRREEPAFHVLRRGERGQLINRALHLREARRRVAPQRGELLASRAQRALGLQQFDAHARLGHARAGFLQRRDLAGRDAVRGRLRRDLREAHGILREPQALLCGQHLEEQRDGRSPQFRAARDERRRGLVARTLGRRHAGRALAAQLDGLAQLQRGGPVVAAQVFQLRAEHRVGPGAGLHDGALGGLLLARGGGQAGVGLQHHRDGAAKGQRACGLQRPGGRSG